MPRCSAHPHAMALESTPAASGAARLDREQAETRSFTPAPTPGQGVASKSLQSPAHFLRCCVFFCIVRYRKGAGLSFLRKDGEIDRELIVCLEGIPLTYGGGACSQASIVLIFLTHDANETWGEPYRKPPLQICCNLGSGVFGSTGGGDDVRRGSKSCQMRLRGERLLESLHRWLAGSWSVA